MGLKDLSDMSVVCDFENSKVINVSVQYVGMCGYCFANPIYIELETNEPHFIATDNRHLILERSMPWDKIAVLFICTV